MNSSTWQKTPPKNSHTRTCIPFPITHIILVIPVPWLLLVLRRVERKKGQAKWLHVRLIWLPYLQILLQQRGEGAGDNDPLKAWELPVVGLIQSSIITDLVKFVPGPHRRQQEPQKMPPWSPVDQAAMWFSLKEKLRLQKCLWFYEKLGKLSSAFKNMELKRVEAKGITL